MLRVLRAAAAAAGAREPKVSLGAAACGCAQAVRHSWQDLHQQVQVGVRWRLLLGVRRGRGSRRGVRVCMRHVVTVITHKAAERRSLQCEGAHGPICQGNGKASRCLMGVDVAVGGVADVVQQVVA